MSVSLANLMERVKGQVPAKDGVPSEAQYEQAVQDAVADYSRRCPLQKVYTLSVVSGTAAYGMPMGFLYVVRMLNFSNLQGVIVTDTGLIPAALTYQERYTQTNGVITFYPTPTYSLGRDVWYAAEHMLNESSIYTEMGADEGRIVLLKAAALATQLKANAAADLAWRYSVGAESVSKENLVKALREQADSLEAAYLAAVGKRIGVVGMSAGLVDFV